MTKGPLTFGSVSLFHGDSLHILRSLPGASVDAVITDPPYSSGGLFRSDRAGVRTSDKYVLHGTLGYRPEFHGDNRDQRGYLAWCSLWLAECYRVTRPGGALMCFTDWRQLPTLSDAIQSGGWVWRGIVPWDKTEGVRPQRGWFRSQCEYVLTGSSGGLGQEQNRKVQACLPGCFREPVRPAEKHHMTGKPVTLMKDLMGVLPVGSTILDPFAGGGATLVAAMELGHRAIGIEISGEYFDVIRDRLRRLSPMLPI